VTDVVASHEAADDLTRVVHAVGNRIDAPGTSIVVSTPRFSTKP
jgi:hypothetical protein